MDHSDHDHCWDRIRTELRGAVTEATWELWLEPLRWRGRDGTTLLLEAPDATRTRISGRFGRLIQACAAAAVGPAVTVQLVGPGEDVQLAPTRDTSPLAATLGSRPAELELNPRFTFDQFVIGDGNRLAHAASLAVAEMPGLAYNPLFLCGSPGLGKTHLLHSIGNYVVAHGNGLTVRYTTVEAFTNAFISAVHGDGRGIDAFKHAFRGVDVLLVDDVQFLHGKARTEQEFFHTFNALHATGAQVVLSSDRPPRDIEAVEDRLRERFESGLVARLDAPDLDTRVTILHKRLRQDEVADVDPAAVRLIAERVETNVRTLEGALIRAVAFASLTGRALTPALADEVLGGLYPELRPRRATVRGIQERVSEAFGVTVEDLLSSSRAAPVTWPRHVAMYLVRELTGQSLPAIGAAFGGRSHTTVLAACRRTRERMGTDPDADAAVRAITDSLAADRG